MRRIHLLPMLLLSVGSAAFFCGTLWAQDGPKPVPTLAAANAPAASAAAAGDTPIASAKEIPAKNDAVMGGTQSWERVTSRRMKGLYQTEDSSLFFSIEILQKSPDKSLYKINLPNDVVLRDVCGGHSAWIEDPRGGYHEVTVLPACCNRQAHRNAKSGNAQHLRHRVHSGEERCFTALL